MSPVEIIDVGRDAVFVLIKVSGPIMMVGLSVGLLVSVFQSITQLQEMTLTFVPKILAIFASLIVFLPFMINTLTAFMNQIAQRIIGVS
ncbi:MAG: flagellar biosynthesis protein FliQ [Alphaproteobacteria bacterium]|nr:flagellar biosynthesis protein FliQ [Alphaproteobacteria bacterium]